MAEKTKGGGYRERIYFDEELWNDIEVVASHMRIKPPELVKLLTAMGLAQMKGLTLLTQVQVASGDVAAAEARMDADFERYTGNPASDPLGRGAAAPSAPRQEAPPRQSNDGSMQAGGGSMVVAPRAAMVSSRPTQPQTAPSHDEGRRYQASPWLENRRR